MTETRFRLPKAKRYRPLGGLFLLVAAVILIFAGHPSHAYAQVKQNSATAARPPAPVDPNKYAVIINGASGEPAYAKQFEQWTAGLQAALVGRFGFGKDHLKVLTEKP